MPTSPDVYAMYTVVNMDFYVVVGGWEEIVVSFLS